MDEKALRLALIGAGRWGSIIAKTLDTIPQCTLTHQVTREWKTLLDKGDIDAVLIATPPSTHAEIALAFIERGLPVFIEKPVTLNVPQAQQIADAASKKGVMVFVGHIHLYNPAYLATKKLLEGAGTIKHIFGEGASNGPIRPDYSAMWDWAPHDVSMMLDMLGEMPLSVSAWGSHEESYIRLTFPSAAIATIFSSKVMPQKRRRLTVVAEKAAVVHDDTLPEKKVTLFENEMKDVSNPPYELGMPLKAELEAFIDCVKNKTTPKTDAQNGLNVVKILAAAEESIKQNGAVIKI